MKYREIEVVTGYFNWRSRIYYKRWKRRIRRLPYFFLEFFRRMTSKSRLKSNSTP